MKKIKFAPKKIFDQILEWTVIPTFDLVIQYGNEGVIIVKRKIAPYKNQWALPGLRMFKGENIDDTLRRIARDELGLEIDPEHRVFLGQYVGKFSTEHHRQDISTGYLVRIPQKPIVLNPAHFSTFNIVKHIPANMGGMYKFYLRKYFK